MTSKTFEVRDIGTFIAVLATRLDPECEESRRLLARSGFGKEPAVQKTYVIVTKLHDCVQSRYDAFGWGERTMREAHRHIIANFETLQSGEVIDVQFLLGEMSQPARSELS